MTPGTRANIRTLTPATQRLAVAWVKACEARGLRVTITEGKRSRARQAELHAADPEGAAPPGKSKHEKGTAWDFAFRVGPRGVWSYDDAHPWEVAGELGEAVGLEWGGRWKKRFKGKGDRCHFQLRRTP